jgi:ribosome biogenesis protein Nip4
LRRWAPEEGAADQEFHHSLTGKVRARVVIDAIVSTKTFRNATKSKNISSRVLCFVQNEEDGFFESSERNTSALSRIKKLPEWEWMAHDSLHLERDFSNWFAEYYGLVWSAISFSFAAIAAS